MKSKFINTKYTSHLLKKRMIPSERIKITDFFSPDADAVLRHGDCLDLLKTIPSKKIKLIVTSPPYNIGKEYEKRLRLEEYVEQQKSVIVQCVRTLSDNGSICWQIGNYVNAGEIVPLDIILYPIFKNLGLNAVCEF